MANIWNKSFVNTSALVRAANAEEGIATEPPAVTGALTVNKFDGNAMAALAKSLAEKVDDETAAVVSGLMKAKEESISGTIALMLHLLQNYGGEEDADGNVVDAFIDEFPRPDTDTGNKRDVFDIEVTEGGKTTTKKANFYSIFADSTPQGAAIVKEIDEVKRAMDTNANQSGIREEIAAMNPQELQVRLDFLGGRRATIRTAFKKAMALHFKFQDVNSLRYVKAEPLWLNEVGGPVQATLKPIMVWQPADEGKPVTKYAFYGIGQFLKLDTQKATEKGGTFDALTATAKKKTGGSQEGQKETETPIIKSVDTAVGRIVELYRWADEITGPTSDKADYGKLLKVVNHKDADELAVSIVELSNFLNDIRKEAKLDARYVRLQQAKPELVAEKKAANS